jgi:hypothetical protein
MCDYSLHSIKNRLACEGEQLFVHTFHTGSKGLAAVNDLRDLERYRPAPAGISYWARFRHWMEQRLKLMDAEVEKALPAVCIPPGAQLELHDIPQRMQKEYGVSSHERVTFVQLSADPYRYRDAIRFDNGQEALLQKLTEGLRCDIVSLTLAEESEPELKPFTAAARTRSQVSVG